MESFILKCPDISIRNYCIICKCKVGSKAIGKILKGFCVTKQQSLNFWKTQNILVSEGYRMWKV